MENKRIYSLNLAAYIIATTNLLPQLIEDMETRTFYCVFPQCAGIKTAIKDYKGSNPEIHVHDFLHAIKQLRESIAAAKEVNTNE